MDDIVITAAKRTPMGGFQGAFASLAAHHLGATAIRAATSNSGLAPDAVDEVLMGCVLPAGQGQAPARQATLGAGLPASCGAVTINKMCGSGMKAVMLGHDAIRAGSARIIVAGGMESMTNAPYLLPRARAGYRLGHGQVLDHMFLDGLEDAYEPGRLMGSFAEDCAAAYGFDRALQDRWALLSLQRARDAMQGAFADEITPVETGGRSPRTVTEDEQPLKADPDRIHILKPAFRMDGTVTAANSSSISDGAAALVLMSSAEARARGQVPLARLVGHATHAQAPSQFTTAPIGALRKLAGRTGWALADVDLFEINEAFAVVTLAAIRDLGLPEDRVNIHGGACALGHPIGASGARLLVTLIHALRRYGKRRGMATLCIGGGEAVAVAVEVPD
ncbi:acetyl-CoA acetyltransferase [Gemmobacter aquaticus]|uniref:Acetyl-CoA acetyltransferase n=1 Tax=Gemmobacter aquaticus TaxID=490185 RepID=A0A918DBZ1_9RHOB|nr:acetyl-CoA C-acyltransferase [Gemmobacter aquaticus]GGO27741.1 acetyl-CoA acetyltransferase [Gemmobacter aquaticus]